MDALAPVNGMLSVFQTVEMTGADSGALGAADAKACHIFQLRQRGDSLRIVAPTALERTALKKYGGANAVSVMNGEMFDIKNFSFHSYCAECSALRMNSSCSPLLK